MNTEVKKLITRIRKAQDAVFNGKVEKCHCISLDCDTRYKDSRMLHAWWTVNVHITVKVPACTLAEAYKGMKEKHQDALLLLRVGDFYEAYSEDARTAADVLGITLTRRSGVPVDDEMRDMTGFPHHALDSYLPRLVRAGKRVAICDSPEMWTYEEKSQCELWMIHDDDSPAELERIAKEISECIEYKV